MLCGRIGSATVEHEALSIDFQTSSVKRLLLQLSQHLKCPG